VESNVIISHKKKFVILAPWKTASSTMLARLGSYCESPYSRFYDYNPFLKRIAHQHITHADFLALPESHLGYYTAAFARNPYDRAYSGYLQLIKDIQEYTVRGVFTHQWIRDMVMKQLSENFEQLAQSGFNFNKWISLIEPHQIFEIGRNSSFPLHPAHFWTHREGKPAVDFIGRVENFEADFEALCKKLDVEPAAMKNANVKTDPALAGEGGYKYTQHMNPASIAKINALFKEDFDYFGYRKL